MRRECETYFQTLLWLSDAASTLGFSKGETWFLGNVCLRWRVGSSLVSAEICAPSVSTVAFSSVVALAQEHPHTARARIGRAAKLSGVAAGWLGLRAHTGWAGLQCWLRIVLNGSINTPLERAEGTTWEPPEHLFSAGFHLNYPPKESEAKLRQLCSSCPPVQRRKVTRCELYPSRFLFQCLFPQTLQRAHHMEQLLCPTEPAAGDSTAIHWYPAFAKEGCKLLILH